MKKYTVFSHGYASPLLRCNNKLSTELDFDEVKSTSLEFAQDDVLYVPSEDGLIWVAQRTHNTAVASAIELFKDKAAFRQVCAAFTPGFFFKEVAVRDVHLLKLDFESRDRYVIKPKRGYYATAVRIITQQTNLHQLQDEIEEELAVRSRYYPETMLSSQSLILEEFIGQPIENSLGLDEAELAVDLFYDRNGDPVIAGLYHHPHPTCSAYFHTLYYTSKAIYARFSGMVLEFFNALQKQGMNLKNFPVHAEFKVIGTRLVPIEINPYRFGGYGLADLLHHACGINPYETYFESRHPDWSSLWKGKPELYGCVVGYNGQDVDLQTHEPQREAFKAMFGNALLHYQALDHLNCPLFAMAYFKTMDPGLLHQLLTVDYRKFFTPATASLPC
ncbi:MAG TPA: ATP-grasp domain-containing protein [Limnobacter sp.]|nr:ATP-grasp domain-containing protein [Limnobacter sp.]